MPKDVSTFEHATDVMNQKWKKIDYGVMTDETILDAMLTNDVFIYPFDQSQLTGVGYNLRPSGVIISTKTGMPLKEYQENRVKYVVVQPHDTVLISTKEYIRVSRNIMGTIHSRVSLVSQGFGHISTTVDPTWKGPLLIALNNPSSEKKRLILEDSGKTQAFATLVLYHLNSDSTTQLSVSPNRIDILMSYRAKPGMVKQLLFHSKLERYNNFIDRIKHISCNADDSERLGERLESYERLVFEIKKLFNSAPHSLTGNQELLHLADRCMSYCIECSEINSYYTLYSMLKTLETTLRCIASPDGSGFFPDEKMRNQAILSYCDACIGKIHCVHTATVWENEYDAIALQSQNHMQSLVMRVVFGDYQSIANKILCILLIISIIAGIVFISYTNKSPLDLDTMVASAMLTFLCNIVLHKFIK